MARTSRLPTTFTWALSPIAAVTVGVTVAVELFTPTPMRPPATARAVAAALSDPMARTLTLLAPALVVSTTPAEGWASTLPSRCAELVPFAVASAMLTPTPTGPPAHPVAVAVC